MKIDLIKAREDDLETVQNLGRFYVYEMSKYCGFLPGWETPEKGLFECIDLSDYWHEPNCPFVINIDNEIAGFALINKVGSTPDVDWNMGQFFILSKYQGKGIGKEVAHRLFNQFPGIWEVSQIPENRGAVEFWGKVISKYTSSFEKTQKVIADPKPHSMIVLKFSSPPLCTQESYTIDYEEAPSVKDESVLLEGLFQEAFRAKKMGRIRSFGFFVRDSKRNILGGAKGITYYGCLYVDSLWVTPELRHQGFGSKLVIASENLGKERQCTFATLTTMDWEALPFYQKLGYQIEHVREGYAHNSKLFLLTKNL